MSLSLLAILVATLLPSSALEGGEFAWCIVCGDRGSADVVLNVLLFMPLGAFLALAGVRRWRVVVSAALFSGAIECAQLFIPGRASSLGDVVSNTAGALAGYALALALRRGVQRPGRPTRWHGVAAASAAVGAVAATGWLVRPAFPPSVYYGQWTPNLGHLEWYRGRVLGTSLGAVALPPDRLDDSRRVRALLLAGAALHIQAVAGPRVPGLASLFSIADEQRREILLLGPDRDDLVFRYRTRATAWGFDQPDLRVIGALRSVLPGDTLDITVRRNGTAYCVDLNHTRTCGLGFTAGSAWALLKYPETLPRWLKRVLGVAWLVGIWLPAGYWTSDQARLLGAAVVAAAALGWVAPATGLVATPLEQWVGAAVGLTAGWLLRRRVLTELRTGPA